MEVSICMLTYQHKQWIQQAIESVLMQETSFEYELIIADDCSSDGTAEIIQQYASKYRDIIIPIFQHENIGPVKNARDMLLRAKGRYIAFLEGDDFWTDSKKLQKQVDFMHSNPECSMVYHASRVIDGNGTFIRSLHQKKAIYTLNDLYPTGNMHMVTGSILGINLLQRNPRYNKFFSFTYYVGDIIFKAAFLKEGKIGYIDEELSCYRRITSHGENYSSLDLNVQRLDAVKAYRAVMHLYRFCGISGALKMQQRVLLDMFNSYFEKNQYRSALYLFFKEMTPFEVITFLIFCLRREN